MDHACSFATFTRELCCNAARRKVVLKRGAIWRIKAIMETQSFPGSLWPSGRDSKRVYGVRVCACVCVYVCVHVCVRMCVFIHFHTRIKRT